MSSPPTYHLASCLASSLQQCQGPGACRAWPGSRLGPINGEWTTVEQAVKRAGMSGGVTCPASTVGGGDTRDAPRWTLLLGGQPSLATIVFGLKATTTAKTVPSVVGLPMDLIRYLPILQIHFICTVGIASCRM